MGIQDFPQTMEIFLCYPLTVPPVTWVVHEVPTDDSETIALSTSVWNAKVSLETERHE